MPKLLASESKKLAVKKSRNGLGIFVKNNCKPGITVFQVRGSMVTCDEDENMDEEERSNTFRYSKNWYISPKGLLGDMLNHACEPNVKLVKKDGKLYIVSIKEITKGSEVLLDYSTIIGPDDSWSMACNCGTNSCRKVIRQFTKLPKAIQKAYLAAGMVPSYIR